MDDKELIVLYWKFYTQSHTHPWLRKYLSVISSEIRSRSITPLQLNNIGLDAIGKLHLN